MDWLDQALSEVGLPPEGAESQQILLVDDSPLNLQVLMHTLQGLGHKLAAANSGARALELARKTRPALVLLDVMMPEMDGYEVCRRMKATPELRDTVVVFCSALEDTPSKVRGFEVGGADFITKPFQPEEVVARVTTHLALSRVLHRLGDRNAELERELRLASEFRAEALQRQSAPLLGTSDAIATVKAGIRSAVAVRTPLLIVGEPNCGSEAAARAIHAASARSDRPFVAVDCAVLSPGNTANLFEPEAAAGGATKLSLAEGGTLFLDSVDRLNGAQQTQLLAVLVGGEEPEYGHDVRVIATTRHSKEGSTFTGEFEMLLAQELRRNTLRLPELIERADDIPALVHHFVSLHSRRLGQPEPAISDETMASLAAYPWPGNLRELDDVLRQSVELSRDRSLHVESRLLQQGIPLGSYRLTRMLGAGAMGEVWEANHQVLPRSAAVKLIKNSGSSGPEATAHRRRFEREARVTANLTSRNTVELYDFGVSEDGAFYYVMERLDGIDLSDAVRRFGPMPPARVAHLLTQACCSLAEAHQSGLVHRDIKPANLFLCRLGLEVDILKVLDFGMVSDTSDAEATRLTTENAIAGTPTFLSPEAAMATDPLTGKADIYALGCVGHWLLTGEPVFDAPNTMALIMKHVMEQPVPPSRRSPFQVPENLEMLLLRCMDKSPDARPSALELWSDLIGTGLAQQWGIGSATDWWATNL